MDVLPPGTYDEPVKVKDGHWALPVVRRCDHADGVMPYDGSVLSVANSCVVSLEEAAAEPEYEKIQKRCDHAGQALGTLATLRLD